MQLAPEDNLRLQVLLRQGLQALKIDESRMEIHALTDKGEARLKLHPTCRDEQYLKWVRQAISTHVLGSPGGYPVYLKRWTRMGQTRSQNLEKLLLLGEPEAVVAVIHAPDLTHELARRAWWAMPDAANARRMLEYPCVAQGELGRELAAFLLEFLPFEEKAQDQIDTVRLVLQPGLIGEAQRQDLWARARRRTAYYVGFLLATPDELPETRPAHPEWETLRHALETPLAQDNPFARQLLRLLSPAGQAWLATVRAAMKKPSDQDTVAALMDAMEAHGRDARPVPARPRSFEDLHALVDEQLAAPPEELVEVLEHLPGRCAPLLRSMLALAYVSEQLVAPIFGLTDAVGSLMRRKIEPVTGPIGEHLAVLSG
jgi:hypothetical protein